MKNRARKPTRAEKEAMSAYGLKVDDWLVQKDLGTYFVVVNKEDDKKTKVIDLYARVPKR